MASKTGKCVSKAETRCLQDKGHYIQLEQKTEMQTVTVISLK